MLSTLRQILGRHRVAQSCVSRSVSRSLPSTLTQVTLPQRQSLAAAASHFHNNNNNICPIPSRNDKNDNPSTRLSFFSRCFSSTSTSAAVSEAPPEFDYDLFVIGGGSGGLATSKEASKLGAKVAVADYVSPSTQGSTWGLGGTCVNVGCIPKKLFHLSALFRDAQADASNLGWKTQSSHSWNEMTVSVMNYIRGLNFGYKVQLREENVKYYNKKARLIDKNTIELYSEESDEGGVGETTTEGGSPPETSRITANTIVIAGGGRPTIPEEITGAKEHCITSDDIFRLEEPPGKTLVLGASYIALECAGFLKGLGFDTTVMVRSILLRGFDRDIARRIGEYMEEEVGVSFIHNTVPTKIEKIEKEEGTEKVHKLLVHYGEGESEEYDTVLCATGRHGVIEGMGLEDVGVQTLNRKIKIDEAEQTNIPNIYAIGDIAHGVPELTPVAIQSGKLLARRLFAGDTERGGKALSSGDEKAKGDGIGNTEESANVPTAGKTKTQVKLMDYSLIPTTVFTPIEYGCVGLSEEEAIEKHNDNLKIFHAYFQPLEWNLNMNRSQQGYIKVICKIQSSDPNVGNQNSVLPNLGHEAPEKNLSPERNLSPENLHVSPENLQVIGLHILGQNAGEIIQGLAVAMRTGHLTKSILDDTIGIHPTSAEDVTMLETEKAEGVELKPKTGC